MCFPDTYTQRTTRKESRRGDRISTGSFTSLKYVPSSPCDCRVTAWHSQTELGFNTHVIVSGTHTVVSNTYTMVSDIHHTMVHGQEGNNGKLLVSNIHTPTTTE